VALVATVMLSRGAAARSATAQAVGLVVLLVALLAGATLAGTTGAAAAVLVGAAVSVAALAVAVPAGWRASLAPPRREVALAALAVVVLLLLRDEVWLWLVVAAAAGALGVLRAFGGTRTAPPAATAPDPAAPAVDDDDATPAELGPGAEPGAGRRLRILHLAFQDWRMPGSGGGAVRTREVDERLAERHEVTALVCAYPGAAERVENGVRWVPVGLPLGRFGAIATYFAALPAAVRRHSADVVVEDFGAPIGSIGPRLRAGRPLVALVQWLNAEEKAQQYRLPFHWVQRRGLRHHRTFIVTSDDIRERVHLDNPSAHVVVVPNGVPREAFDVRAERGRDVVFLGRLEVAQKGLDLLLEAFAAVADRLPGDLVVAGDGPDLAAVRSRAARLGVGHRVRLVGRVEGAEKLQLLASALLVAMPSRFETFGMVAAEAAACGTPVVAFAIPSLREVVTPETGVLVPAFDVAAFAAALAGLAADPDRIERLGADGRERARRWDWDDIARQHEAVYAAAAGPVGAAGRQR
jgi:glycosyltransferase involved in cell wall biosynthesis